MKKSRLAVGALALVVSMMICGCDKLYEMTDSEEAVVVNYSARVVTKFNLRQTEGINSIAVLEKMMEEEKLQEEQQKEQQKTDTNTNKGQPEQKPEGSTQAPQENQPLYASFSQALKLKGIDAVYRSYEVTSEFEGTESFMVPLRDGNEFLILHVDLKNASKKAADCDILSKMPSMLLTVNGGEGIPADMTFLLDDLGTYQGTIPAGGRQKTVLVFQVPKGTVKKVKNMELEVTIDGAACVVQLIAG